jgi:hypothetical protein
LICVKYRPRTTTPIRRRPTHASIEVRTFPPAEEIDHGFRRARVYLMPSADQAQQQAGGKKEQCGECGRQVRNGIHFIDPGDH